MQRHFEFALRRLWQTLTEVAEPSDEDRWRLDPLSHPAVQAMHPTAMADLPMPVWSDPTPPADARRTVSNRIADDAAGQPKARRTAFAFCA
ncbi:hypothetical protein [Consotaella aegiceratis]|uniref:hypothetical protein n=1 Tax=Consotaella aegiceratis TaxID=3097961 RepID=UPI002F41CB01